MWKCHPIDVRRCLSDIPKAKGLPLIGTTLDFILAGKYEELCFIRVQLLINYQSPQPNLVKPKEGNELSSLNLHQINNSDHLGTLNSASSTQPLKPRGHETITNLTLPKSNLDQDNLI